jgi:hypothetical protein
LPIEIEVGVRFSLDSTKTWDTGYDSNFDDTVSGISKSRDRVHSAGFPRNTMKIERRPIPRIHGTASLSGVET